MWVDKTRVYAAKAIDNEYAYGRLNAGHLPTGSREEPDIITIIIGLCVYAYNMRYFSVLLIFAKYFMNQP